MFFAFIFAVLLPIFVSGQGEVVNSRIVTKPTLLYFHFYPRDAILARVLAMATCLSVCLSVTRRYCVKTKKASGMISSPPGSPKTLVF